MCVSTVVPQYPPYLDLSEQLTQEPSLGQALASTMTIHNDFISEAEEQSLIDEVEPYMSNLKYEFDHWDDVSLSFCENIAYL